MLVFIPLHSSPLCTVFGTISSLLWAFRRSSVVNNSPAIAGDAGDVGSIPGSGGGSGNPLQYSCLENPHRQRSLAGYSPWGHKGDQHDLVTKQQLPQYRTLFSSDCADIALLGFSSHSLWLSFFCFLLPLLFFCLSLLLTGSVCCPLLFSVCIFSLREFL